MKFSKALISEIKAYFNKRYSVCLSNSEANRYLNKLGALGSLAYDILDADSPTPGASVTAALTTGCKPVVISRFEGPGAGSSILVSQNSQTPLKDDDL